MDKLMSKSFFFAERVCPDLMEVCCNDPTPPCRKSWDVLLCYVGYVVTIALIQFQAYINSVIGRQNTTGFIHYILKSTLRNNRGCHRWDAPATILSFKME